MRKYGITYESETAHWRHEGLRRKTEGGKVANTADYQSGQPEQPEGLGDVRPLLRGGSFRALPHHTKLLQIDSQVAQDTSYNAQEDTKEPPQIRWGGHNRERRLLGVFSPLDAFGGHSVGAGVGNVLNEDVPVGSGFHIDRDFPTVRACVYDGFFDHFLCF